MNRLFYIFFVLLTSSSSVFGQPLPPPPPAGGAVLDTFVVALIVLSLIYAVWNLRARGTNSVEA